jgi:hypothetical protein
VAGGERFLDRPGVPGPFGALRDEYARAAEDFCRVLETFDARRFAEERDASDPDGRSPRAIARHACSATRGYANDIRRVRGLPHGAPRVELAEVRSPQDARRLLEEGLRWTEGALEGYYDADEATVRGHEFTVSWGVRYDPEMLLEHAVCHLLRHRRQLERWDRPAPSSSRT